MRKILIFVLLILVLISVIVLGSYVYYNKYLNSSLLISEAKTFQIESGSTIEQITSKLEEEGIISNKALLLVYYKLNPTDATSIKAGTFTFNANASVRDMIKILLDPSNDRDDVAILIQEGLRYDEIALIIDAGFKEGPEKKFSKDEYILIVESPDGYTFSSQVTSLLSKYKPKGKNLEGYLYPDTYFFSKSATALDVIHKQILTLSEKLTNDNLQFVDSSDYTLHEYLTIASMVEREAFGQEEMADISDVIHKRLEKGIQGVKLLQIDATLLYIAKDWKADAFKLKSQNSPYNTYLYAGLPPTPISNPGIDSILAALYPKSNDYYFYLHDSDGVIHFAKNQSEHSANVRKYIN
jgi:UPF0755 protein